MELKIEYLPVTELKPYENNARKHAEADVEAIKKSIEEFGFNDPIGIWHDDVFGGSGSTLIACEQLNRKCYMAELDPHYCDVIIQRWENSTGEKAKLLTPEELR